MSNVSVALSCALPVVGYANGNFPPRSIALRRRPPDERLADVVDRGAGRRRIEQAELEPILRDIGIRSLQRNGRQFVQLDFAIANLRQPRRSIHFAYGQFEALHVGARRRGVVADAHADHEFAGPLVFSRRPGQSPRCGVYLRAGGSARL